MKGELVGDVKTWLEIERLEIFEDMFKKQTSKNWKV